ncbi:MAG: glycoside hydrolase family 16 protein [Methylotetracoccus sp.]
MVSKTIIARSIAGLVLSAVATAVVAEPQGAQVYTQQSFGYGKLVMSVQPSSEPGIINGYFMLKYYSSSAPNHEGTWPNGWTEIDFEVVPGNADSFRRTAAGACGVFQTEAGCKQGKLGNRTAASYISANIIGGPENAGAKPDSQVFRKVPPGYFDTLHTYQISYTPAGVRWWTDGITNKRFLYQNGKQLPSPYTNCTNYCDDVHYSQGYQYLLNRDMHIYLNLYSGLGQGFGGPTDAANATKMIVSSVAYYPLIGCNGTECTYQKKPSMLSDFAHNKYTLKGQAVKWTDIWVNEDFQNYPIYTLAANASIVPGQGLVLNFNP